MSKLPAEVSTIKTISKKLTVAAILIIAALSAFALVGCDGDVAERTGVKVVFNLEGATYRNMTEPVVYYYDFKPGTENLIKDPFSLSGKECERANYNFKGWYRTKTGEGENAVYSDKWDFAADKVTDAGVELYACWRQYTFDPGRLDENGDFVSFDSPAYVFDDKPGTWQFDRDDFEYDYSKIYEEDGTCYTFTGVLKDIDGNEWNDDFTHPRGDGNEAVKVVAEYIKGDYTIVRTADELIAASSNSDNIYLMNDIDFKGGEYKGFSAYKGEFDGNGKKISNFKLKYDRGGIVTDNELDGNGLICLSVFGRAVGATVKNVTFENVSVDIKLDFSQIKHVYLAPLFVTAKDCTVSNVSFSGTFTCSELPSGIVADKLEVVSDKLYYLALGGNKFENIGVVNVVDKTGEYFATEA